MNLNTSERLKIVRGDLTQAEFSTMLGVHKNTLGRYERGESNPDSEVCAKICSVFGVSPAWLLLGIGAMKGENTPENTNNEPKGSKEVFLSSHSTEVVTAKLEQELELEKKERRELAMENRKLYREKEELLRENGALREKVARLEGEHDKWLAIQENADGFPALFDEQPTLPSSSHPQRVHK